MPIEPGLIGPSSLFQSRLELKIIWGLSFKAAEESGQCCSSRPICLDKYPSATGSYQEKNHFESRLISSISKQKWWCNTNYLVHQDPRSVPLLQVLLRAVELPRTQHTSTSHSIFLKSPVNRTLPYARYSCFPFPLFFRSGVASSKNNRGKLHLNRRQDGFWIP